MIRAYIKTYPNQVRPESHSLLLPARELVGAATPHTRQTDHPQRLGHALTDLGPGGSLHLKAKGYSLDPTILSSETERENELQYNRKYGYRQFSWHIGLRSGLAQALRKGGGKKRGDTRRAPRTSSLQ
jgi:hypothetical protein